ncbi:hypothetical protein [Streptomyces sp. NPDC101150]|uniref:hypothetical protein n=1 Tax=Streptomyces sp. NPDC101150 TaxID=3366114 RepID=UPI0037FD1424
MLAHILLAVMADQEREKGVTPPTHPTSWTSRRHNSAICWQLSPTTVLHDASTR